MNILIFSWRGPGHPNAGGAEIATHKHAVAWISAGHSVTLFTSGYKNAKRYEEVDGVKIIRFGNQYLGVHIIAFFWFLIKKHDKFDIIVDQFHGIPFFTPLYAGTKVLAYIHEIAKDVWKLNSVGRPFSYVIATLGTTIEPYIFKFFYKNIPFMTVSESTRNDLVAFGIPKKNITIIHNGAEITLPKRGITKEGIKTAVYLGVLTKDKGIEDALKVFSEIERKDEDWQFWVVGKGEDVYVKKLKQIAKRLSLKSKIKFWGYVSDDTKFKLLSRAHLLINTSFREGWSLVNIEANACGIPVLGYKVPGIVDSVVNNKTGLLVEKGDYRTIATNAIKLLGNTYLYSQFHQNCISWAKKFTWQKSTQESLKLIEDL